MSVYKYTINCPHANRHACTYTYSNCHSIRVMHMDMHTHMQAHACAHTIHAHAHTHTLLRIGMMSVIILWIKGGHGVAVVRVSLNSVAFIW